MALPLWARCWACYLRLGGFSWLWPEKVSWASSLIQQQASPGYPAKAREPMLSSEEPPRAVEGCRNGAEPSVVPLLSIPSLCSPFPFRPTSLSCRTCSVMISFSMALWTPSSLMKTQTSSICGLARTELRSCSTTWVGLESCHQKGPQTAFPPPPPRPQCSRKEPKPFMTNGCLFFASSRGGPTTTAVTIKNLSPRICFPVT